MTVAAETPHRIGPYRVLHELGRGGMGVVYRAARDDGSEHALKIPSRELAHVFGGLRREIHALGRLRHPGVVRIVDAGVEQGVPWYAMELLEGRTLDQILDFQATGNEKTAEALEIRNGAYGLAVPPRPAVRTDLQRALTLMYRLARVLTYVHSRGIVHRDLKPGNVFVRDGDRPVLVDFGLVTQFHALNSREVLEVSGRPTGTASYVAPEQARGELVDARADLYSFGVMLYEIVAGRPPFDGQTVADVFRQHIHDQPVPPSAFVQDVPPRLEELILRLLEKRRSRRLGYAEDVASWLVDEGATAVADADHDAAPYLYRPDLVGRRATIDSATARINTARRGEGAFLVLGGVSGIGKTSVATVLAREATLMHVRVVAGESASGGAPLHPLRPLLREIADRSRADRAVFERVLGPHLDILRDLEPALAGLDADIHPDIQPLAPDVVSRRLFPALAETLAAFAREQPLLVILDDLQWADEVTLRFLASLGADYFDGLPLVILGTFRVDEAGPELRTLTGAAHVTNVPLERLDDGSVAEIVRSMLAAPDAPPGFLRFLASQTEGNPFFVAEYLRSAVAKKLLFREHGRWRIAASGEEYESLALPGTIRDLMAHRLGRLTPIARRAAEAAAVLGREPAEDRFFAVLGESESDALDAIAELTEQHVFEPSADRLRFAHDKLREAAYAGIDQERRRELHRRAAESIEQTSASDEELRRHEAELARHCDAAGLRAKAIHYYARAAETAVGTGACREAVDLMTRAIALEDEHHPSRHTPARAHWERILSFAYLGLGDLAASSAHARESLRRSGIALPETHRGWQRRLAAETVRQTAHLLLPRRLVRSRKSGTGLRDIAMAAQKFSEARYYTDEKTVMLASGLLAVNSAERLGDDAGLMHTYANFGAVTSGLGLNRIARRYYAKARALAQSSNDFAGLAHIGYTSAVLYITTCDWKSCALHFDDAVAAATKTGDHQLIEMNLIARGFFELYRGRIAAAADTFDGVRARAQKRLNRQHAAWGYTWRAASLLLLNRGVEALGGLAFALELLAPYDDNAKLSSYALRCQTLLHLGRLDEAIEAADVTSAAVAKLPAIIWEKYRGLSAPAEVYLEAWERGRDADNMRRATDVLLRRLELVSRRMPLARPVALRLSGVRESVGGNTRRGEKLLRESIAAAVRLGLPVEEGISTFELARRCASLAERRALHDRAHELLSKTGCALYVHELSS